MLTDEDERSNALGRMVADPEAETRSPRQADEVRGLDIEEIENRDGISNPDRHRVGRLLVRLVALAMAPVVNEDGSELIREGSERHRQRGSADQRHRIEEPTVDHDRRTGPAVILERDACAVERVRGVRHGGLQPP